MEKRSLWIKGLPVRCSILLTGLFLFWTCIPSPAAEESKQGKTETAVTSREGKAKEAKMEDVQRLTEQEGEYLLSVARKTIEKELFEDATEDRGDGPDSPRFKEKRGTFVTLTINKNLRGCIGYIIPQGSLLKGIEDNAISAAFDDPRFNPMTVKEWKDVKIEISILTSPAPLAYSDADDLLKKIRPDVDGVIIKKGSSQATFLPQVWEQLPDKKAFFTHLCLKAGMDGNEWKKGELTVFTYQVQAFEEE